MKQQGQVFELESRGSDGKRLWAYRYRTGTREELVDAARALLGEDREAAYEQGRDMTLDEALDYALQSID